MTKLRILVREFEGFHRAIREQAESFRRLEPDAEIEFVSMGLPDLFIEMTDRQGLSSGAWDIAFVLTDWIPQFHRQHLLGDLRPYVVADPPEDWPQGWPASLRGLQEYGGQLLGLPYHDGPVVLCYRADLFDDAKEQSEFERRFSKPLRAPETWDEFVDVARFFTRPGDGLHGAAIAAYPDGHNNVYDFLTLLFSHGGKLMDDSGAFAFRDSAGLEALSYLQDLIWKHRVVPENCFELDSVKSGAFFMSGRAAMMWNWFGFAAAAHAVPESSIRGKVRCALAPRAGGPRGRHASLNVYWVLSSAAGSRWPDLAYRFIRHCASPEMDLVTARNGAVGTRFSTLRNQALLGDLPMYGILEEAHRIAETLPQVENFAEIAEILGGAVYNALRHNHAAAEALRTASEQLQGIERRH